MCVWGGSEAEDEGPFCRLEAPGLDAGAGVTEGKQTQLTESLGNFLLHETHDGLEQQGLFTYTE